LTKVLITGCAGFIGSNILRHFLKYKKSWDIIGVDNLITGGMENINDLLGDFEFVKGDLISRDVCQEITRGVELICHQAALPSVPRSVDDPIKSNENNVTATVNLLKAAVDNRVRRVVYASSSSVYGDNPVMPRKEDMLPMPKSPYAVSKLTGEYYMGAFNKCYDIDTCSLRYFNVFGPRQNPKSQYAAVIPKFITAAIKEEPITVYGDGLQSRDFSFIDNNIDANLRVLESQKDLKGEVINIACNKQYTLLDMIRDIEEIVEHRLNVKFEDARRGDVKHSLADIAKAETLLGYKSKVEFKEGLIRTFEYYKGCADGEGT